MKENGASVKEMEAAAIAWVAQQFKVPFFAIKVITDIVDGGRPTHEEFLGNLHSAAQSLQRELPRIIKFIANKNITEL